MRRVVLATMLTTTLGLVQAGAQLPDDTAFQQGLDRRMKLCRDFNCYYQVCVDISAHADEMLIQTLRNDPAVLKAQEHNLWRNKPSEVRRNCTDTANIDAWCHGNDDCIVEGQLGQERAKKEGRPMSQQDWLYGRCVNESIKRHEDRETTRLSCGGLP